MFYEVLSQKGLNHAAKRHTSASFTWLEIVVFYSCINQLQMEMS
jgi:hypothetical protein